MTKSSAARLAVGVVLGIFIGRANAQSVLFSDTFDRANSHDIQASLTGITDNTSSGLAADTVYTQAWLDPNNAAPTSMSKMVSRPTAVARRFLETGYSWPSVQARPKPPSTIISSIPQFFPPVVSASLST